MKKREKEETTSLTREFIRQFGAEFGYRHGSAGCRCAETEAGGKSNGKGNTFFRFADPTTVAGLTGKVDKPGVKGRPVAKGEGGLRTANKSRGVSISRRLWLAVSNDTVQYIIQIAMLIQLYLSRRFPARLPLPRMLVRLRSPRPIFVSPLHNSEVVVVVLLAGGPNRSYVCTTCTPLRYVRNGGCVSSFLWIQQSSAEPPLRGRDFRWHCILVTRHYTIHSDKGRLPVPDLCST